MEVTDLNNETLVDQLVTENIGLAHHCAAQQFGMDYDEAFSSAMNSLWNAAKKWDAAKGARFAHFATSRIKWDLIGLWKRSATQKRGGGVMHIHLDEPLLPKKPGIPRLVADIVPDENADDPSESTQQHINKATVAEAVSNLNDHRRRIIMLRYGLNGEPPMLSREVGVIVGISEQAVNKQEHKARRELVWLVQQARARLS